MYTCPIRLCDLLLLRLLLLNTHVQQKKNSWTADQQSHSYVLGGMAFLNRASVSRIYPYEMSVFFFVASACVHDVAVFWNWYKFEQHSGWLMVLSRCVHFRWVLFSIHVGFIVRQWCLRVWMHGWLLMSRWVCVCVCICVCSGERWFAYSALNRDFARIFCIVLESLLCAVQYFFGW